MSAVEPTAAGPSVTAILTAYHPDERLGAVVESALTDCAQVIVADNTPAASPSLAAKLDDPRVRVISIGSNLGLAGALNRAVKQLPEEADAVLLLDQRSILPQGLVAGLVAHLDEDHSVGVAAPTPWDAGHEAAYTVGAGLRAQVADREAVIASGMLVRRDLIDRIPFREDLFNDFVDIAFCAAVRRTGARIVQDYRIGLPHSTGDLHDYKLGPLTVRVQLCPAWRQYWIARNGVRMAMEAVRGHPQGLVPMTAFLCRKFAATALFGPDRGARLTALSRGVRDGVLNRAARRYLPEGAVVRAAR